MRYPASEKLEIIRLVEQSHLPVRRLDNLTPADVYFGRGQTILLQRERIKRAAIHNHRLQHQLNAA